MSTNHEAYRCVKISHTVYANLVRREQDRLRKMDELVASVRAEHSKQESLKVEVDTMQAAVAEKRRKVQLLYGSRSAKVLPTCCTCPPGRRAQLSPKSPLLSTKPFDRKYSGDIMEKMPQLIDRECVRSRFKRDANQALISETSLVASSGTLFTDNRRTLRDQTTQADRTVQTDQITQTDSEVDPPSEHAFALSEGPVDSFPDHSQEFSDSFRFSMLDPMQAPPLRREFFSMFPRESRNIPEDINPDEPLVWTRYQWHRNKYSRKWVLLFLLLLLVPSACALSWWYGFWPNWLRTRLVSTSSFDCWLYRRKT